jgi:hypothetical protein
MDFYLTTSASTFPRIKIIWYVRHICDKFKIKIISILPLQRIALLNPRASAVPELMCSTTRCFIFFKTRNYITSQFWKFNKTTDPLGKKSRNGPLLIYWYIPMSSVLPSFGSACSFT